MMQVCTMLILLLASMPIAFQSVRIWADPAAYDPPVGPGLPQVERLEVVVPPPAHAVHVETPNFLGHIVPALLD